TFTAAGEPDGITGTIEYRTDIYNPDTIHTFVRRLHHVLAAITAGPERRLSSLDIVDLEERAHLAEIGNQAVLVAPEPARVATVTELFAIQVAAAPHAIAVTFGGHNLTYRELDDASNRLAHRLIGAGASRGVPVALLMERSAAAVVGMLAALKAGAPYLAIDPALPDERITFMLTDAGPDIVISNSEHRCRVAGFGVSVVDVDDPAIDTSPQTALAHPEPDDLAYLIYTSGTTGMPKGVAIAHRNLAHLVDSSPTGLPVEQVWTQCHSYAFDFSVWEIWAALLGGGRLVVVPDEVVHSPEDFHALLVAEHVTVLTQTPSAVTALRPQGLESAALLLGGELCPVEVVQQWAPGRVMINAYGPTETTIYASMTAPLTAATVGSGVPIGAPVPGAGLVVLDSWLRPVPVGVVGE
ncbi:AMP-binding protein, partial [Mycolicibacterium sp. BiH015]|uniref:AMP-binding protein n=1 Tax=Mycolicibacterium sp. BiH015 TaxID=3018808 RepID=UPI0022E7FCEE